MSTRKLGVLIHGAGWVSTQHIQAFTQNPDSEVVAISSRTLSSAQKRADEAGLTGIGVYDDLDRALQQEGIDIVAVCTPQHVHCENVLAAAAAGKHLVIEKPIGNSLDELRQMRDAVRAAGVQSVVSFVLRWNPMFKHIKSLIADGTVGDVFSVEADYLHNISSFWSGWEDARRKDQGVSAHLVGGCHAIDAVRWFAGGSEYEAAEPVEVFGYSGGYRKGSHWEYNYQTHTWAEGVAPMEYDGLELTLVRFANGVIGKVSVNFDCVIPYTFPVRVFGDRGTIFDNRVWSHQYRGQEEWEAFDTILPNSGDVTHHPFQAQVDHFVDCILRDTASHCDLDDAVKTHEVVFAAQECYRTGQPVRLPLL